MRVYYTSLVFILAFLLSSSTIKAQRDFDALKSDIIQAETEAKRIEGLITLGSVYNRTQLDSINYYADSLSNPNFQDQEFAQVGQQFLEALVAYHEGNLDQAIEQLEISRRFFEANGAKNLQMRALNFLGIAYARTNEVEQSLAMQELQIELCGDDPDYRSAKQAAYGNMANSLRRLGEFAKAIYSLEQAIELSDGDPIGPMGMSYLNMGQMLISLRLYDRALDAFKNIQMENFPSESVKGAVYSGMAQAHLLSERLDSAYFYYQRAFEITETSGNWQQTLRPQLEMALISISLQNHDLAEMHIEKAESLISRYQYPPPAFIDLYLAKIKLNILRDNLSVAKSIAEEFEAFVNDNSIVHLSKDGFRVLSELYEKLDDAETALKFEKIYSDLDISPVSVSENARIAEQRAQLALLEKDEIIQEQSSKKEFYQGLAFPVITVALIFISISIFLFKYYRKEKLDNVIKDNELKELKEKLEKISKESSRPEKAEHITLKSKALIKLNDLNYISSDGPYVEFHLKSKNNPEIDRNSLKSILDELPSKKFIQVHRSHIVNIDSVKSIYSNKVILENGVELNVSRSYKDKLDLLLRNN